MIAISESYVRVYGTCGLGVLVRSYMRFTRFMSVVQNTSGSVESRLASRRQSLVHSQYKLELSTHSQILVTISHKHLQTCLPMSEVGLGL